MQFDTERERDQSGRDPSDTCEQIEELPGRPGARIETRCCVEARASREVRIGVEGPDVTSCARPPADEVSRPLSGVLGSDSMRSIGTSVRLREWGGSSEWALVALRTRRKLVGSEPA